MRELTHHDAARTVLQNQCAEDPRLEPFEKQTAFHLEGDADRIEISSSRKCVFAKLLQRPAFDVKWLNTIDKSGNKHCNMEREKVAADPSLTIIEVVGEYPVGGLSLGSIRKSNSHAEIVKSI